MKEPDFKQMTRREIEDYLVERSMVDPAFRERLLADAPAAIRALGIRVGGDVRVQVLVERPDCFYVVLPQVADKAATISDELSETELEQVAGGFEDPAVPTEPWSYGVR